MGLAGAVLSGFALALLAPWISRAARGAAGWILAIYPVGLTVYFASLGGRIAAGEVVAESYPWVPDLGVSLSLRADGWSLVLALLVAGVGALVTIFSEGYLAGDPARGRFYAFLLMFMASMLGVTVADNLVLVYVFWELTGIASFLLIGFHHGDAGARAAAWQALFVTVAGGLCLLTGVLLLGIAGGSLETSTLLTRGAAVRGHSLYTPIFVLMLLGAATKSAQFPFHFWLPAAMAAPTPVSAYLHSATLVQAGVYLLGRLHPVLGGTDTWRYGVTAVGAVTMLVGAYLAWLQTDLKRILAYSTVSTLGMLVMLLGPGRPAALVAMVVNLVAHAAYKGALFLVAGSVDKQTGTRDVTRLSGLGRHMPITAVAAGLAGLSMAGVPPLLGFLGKESVYGAMLGAAPLLFAAVLANAVNVLVACLVVLKPFSGRAAAPRAPVEVPFGMWLGPLVLGAVSLGLGLAAGAAGSALVAPAAAAVLGAPLEIHLSVLHALSPWHAGHVNVLLLLSAVTLAAGAAAYAGRDRLARAARPLDAVLAWGPARWYEWTLDGIRCVANWQTRLLQNGYLRSYLLITIVTTVAVVGAALRHALGSLVASWEPGILPHEAVLCAIVLLAALVVVRARSRLAAVTALGVVGYGVALIFALFGAPDLAMTQFATETLTVILFVLVLYRVPRFVPLSSAPSRFRDAVVALSGGVLMTLLVLLVSTEPGRRLTPYYAVNSVPRGHGRNVVDVILVDFRALDTLGEITVVTVAAIGGYALMKLRPEAPP